MKKRFVCIMMCVIMLAAFVPAQASDAKELRIMFTHDIHSYFVNAISCMDGVVREHGGAARLKTLLDNNRTQSSIYVDGGDFSMGTLLQAGFATDAYELRLLGDLGCDVTTFGNHEFDYGDDQLANMLLAARTKGENLPQIVQSNCILQGEHSKKAQLLVNAMQAYGVKPYTVIDKNDIKIAVFGLFGIDCLECAPTAEIAFTDYIESAKATVELIRGQESPDVVICLSHCGTAGDGKTGEDFDLAKQVPGIDVIISSHSHTEYTAPITVNNTIIVSGGEYLKNLGVLDITVRDGAVECAGYKLLPCDGTVAEDEILAQKLTEYKQNINNTYLAQEGVGYDDVICRSNFDFISLQEMTETHGEYPFGDLIADAYMYEAEQNGITDIDVALVGLGTVRGTFNKGDITTAKAFECCSLGVGADGSCGHPLLSAYITGKELRLLTELDASLGPLVSYIKMSYSGLSMTFNTERVLLDRVCELYITKNDGTKVPVEDDKTYKVVCNMYAANMLGMLNGLSKGILKIEPKYADGTVITDFYTCTLKNTQGNEIKEWVAFKNYLLSFEKQDGVSVIPESYAQAQGRKNVIAAGGAEALSNPGLTTIIVLVLQCLVIVATGIVMAVVIIRARRRRIAEKQNNK